MMMQMLAAFAELDREMIRERTRAGLARARSGGRAGGRKPKLSRCQGDAAVEMVISGQTSAAEFRIGVAVLFSRRDLDHVLERVRLWNERDAEEDQDRDD